MWGFILRDLEWDEKLVSTMEALSDRDWHDVEDIDGYIPVSKEEGIELLESLEELDFIELKKENGNIEKIRSDDVLESLSDLPKETE